ncbi:coenzyme F390 synthetase [Sesbania bispinosa]|nr:coenzyme F390 synthetase [Sesbania bispinosa]
MTNDEGQNCQMASGESCLNRKENSVRTDGQVAGSTDGKGMGRENRVRQPNSRWKDYHWDWK